MIFSRASEYAIRAMLYVAAFSQDGPVTVRKIAKGINIPSPTLAKVVQSLARKGLLTSYKGPGGGVVLGRPAAEVTLLEVVEVIEGDSINKECVMGVPGCSEQTTHCPLHDRWGAIRGDIVAMLGERSVAEFAAEFKSHDYVLARKR